MSPSWKQFNDQYGMWHVCHVRDESPAGAPFLVSRNVHVEDGAILMPAGEDTPIRLDRAKP